MNPWALPSVLALSLVVGLAVHLARHRQGSRLGPPLRLCLIGTALFTVGDVATFLAPGPRSHTAAIVGVYAGLAILLPGWWLTTLRFAEVHERPFAISRHPLGRWAPVGLSAVFLLALLTNPWHGLFLTPRPHARSLYGPLWALFAIYGYGLVAASFAMLATLARRLPGQAARGQARLLAGACAVPTLANVLYVSTSWAWPFDPTSLGLAVAVGLFVTGIERRQLLALSPALLDQVLRQDTEPVMLLDGTGALVHGNPAAFAWLGLPETARPSDAPARIAERLLAGHGEAPVDPERLRKGLLDPERQLHALFRSRDGETWLRLSSKALPGPRGRAELVVVRLRDETGLQRTSQALAEQAATLEAVLSSSGDGILVVDWPAGRVRYVNRAFVEIVGLVRTPAVGDDAETVRRAVHESIREPEKLDEVIERGARDPHSLVPLVVSARDGRIVEGSGRPVMREGRVVARLFQVRDTTERRRAEDAVRLSQKLESLSVMAGGIAHDFNNLLVSMLGNAELALDMLPADAEARAPVSDVEAAAKRARELTRQLLAYAGRTRPEPEEADLSAIARDVLSLLGGSIPKTVRIETSLATALPAVVGDPAQLRQVCMNLVRNAAEALDERGGHVRVETGVAYVAREARLPGIDGEVSPARPLVFLRVSDDGAGMDETTRERIFDPFFSTKRSGRGLGLAASLGIARSHGGSLQVESAPEEGSSFTVLLPSTGQRVRPRIPEPAEADPDWQGEGTVLVVDDEPGVLRVARRILESAGFDVEEAEDGVEALERFDARGGGYRAVLLDLTMPRMSGEETWEALRKRDPDLPVLLSSGYPEARRRTPDAPRCGFVGKPYTKAALIEALRALLEPAD